MKHFDFSSSLNEAINIYTDPEVKSWLSFDGQIYLHCPACQHILWCNPLYLLSSKEDRIKVIPCGKCQKQGLKLLRFRQVLSVICHQCRYATSFDRQSPIPCTQCGSTHFVIFDVQEVPRFPSTFGTAFEERSEDWGVSVYKDLQFIQLTIRGFRSSAAFHSTCLHLIDFIRHLFERGKYEGDDDLRSELMNLAAQLLKQVFKETGDVRVGLQSITLTEETLTFVKEDIDIALYGHNLASNIYSLLAKGLEDVANALSRRNLRKDALEQSEKVLQLYASSNRIDQQTREIKCSEVEWLIGDIIGAGSPGDKALVLAVQWYDKALSRKDLPSELQAYIRESRDQKIRKMSAPPPKYSVPRNSTAESVLSNIGPRQDAIQIVQQLEYLAQQAFAQGDTDKGLEHLCVAYGIIRAELASSSRDVILRNYGSPLLKPVVALARTMVDLDSAYTGLAILEDYRAFAIWERRSYEDVSKKSGEILLRAKLAQLLGAQFPPAFDQEKLEEAQKSLDKSIKMILLKHSNPYTFVTLDLYEGEVFTILCRFDGDDIAIETRSLVLTDDAVEELIKCLLTLSKHNAPTIVRPKRVKKLIEAARVCFGGIFEKISATPNEPITLITSLGIVPFEALSYLSDISLSPYPIRYAPSITIAAAMMEAWTNRKVLRVLFIGYKGHDLLLVDREIQSLSKLFGNNARVLTGNDLNRATILSEIQSQQYDIIHFACHGVYDRVEPLHSALLLDQASTDVEDRISAADLLGVNSLRGYPLIVLSACSSSVIAVNGSNNYLGLMGAFLRVGVGGIVGSRWPVGDKMAFELMECFYQNIVNGLSPGDAFYNLQVEFKNKVGIDDWMSFMYLGC